MEAALRPRMQIHGTRVSGLLGRICCTALTKLCLGPADVTDLAWRLGACTPAFASVRTLWVIRGNLGDADLAAGLGGLSSLRRLYLFGPHRFTGSGLGALAACSRITDIALRECEALSDAGLLHLARGALRSLASLEVSHCGDVTGEALDTLRAIAADAHGRELRTRWYRR